MWQGRFKNRDETVRFGIKLGRSIKGGSVVAMTGQLGAGKTTLIKGIAKGLAVEDADHVNSPSFVILKEYRGRVPLYHFDVYRLHDAQGMETVGYREYFYGEGISVVEWADRIREILPDEYLNIELAVSGDDERDVKITPRGVRYERLMDQLRLK